MATKKRSGPTFVETKHDEIGFWSEIKLEVLREYWPKYTSILKKQSLGFHTLYVDAFAGSGQHVAKNTGEFVKGSPARALDVQPPFDEYHFIDMDAAKVRSLEALAAARPNVHVHHGDCNDILVREIFPLALYKNYRRAICLLDPYSLQLDWNLIAQAGQMKSVEIFLNFPIMDINRNVLRGDGAPVSDAKAAQMTRFWGDASWRDAGYRQQAGFFDVTQTKVENWELVAKFAERLRQVAGFEFVPEPIAMRNTQRATVYYLFFAGNNGTGAKIVKYIFDEYRSKGLAR